MAPRERAITHHDEGETKCMATLSKLEPQDKWIDKVDLNAWREDMKELGKRLLTEQGPDDVAHLHKMIFWSNACTFIGIATMAVVPFYFLLPAVFLSIGTTTRWTMIAHHTCHGGYDRCEKSGRFNRFKFGVQSLWRRLLDWFDWMLPEAWNVEHNNLHHYHLGEKTDPDLVERNLATLRELDLPLPVKYMAVGIMSMIWKWWYYSPNTFKELRIKEIRKTNPALLKPDTFPKGFELDTPATLTSLMAGGNPEWLTLTAFMTRAFGPYVIYRFFLVPLPLLALGMYINPSSPYSLFLTAFFNLVLADIFGNMHSFLIVVTNHAGNDLYKFATPCRAKTGTFFLRQVVSSANFAAGTDIIDFLHGWLNYQIEHHCWPDLSMLSYQKSMPYVKELCARHNIPYVQESVFTRLIKTSDIMVGIADQRTYPVDREQGDV